MVIYNLSNLEKQNIGKVEAIPYLDFNNPADFSPDTNSQEISAKCFKWLLYPKTVKDLYSSDGFIIQNRGKSFYDMVDPDDALITMKMIQDFVQMNEGTEKPLEIGADVEVFTPFLGEKTKVDVPGKKLDLQTCVQILKKFWL